MGTADLTPGADAETTIVTCIEAGGLEEQVVLLARSLRRLGGRYADLPFVAVKPRAGPGLRRATLRMLDELGVRYVDQALNVATGWWAHANKPAVLLWADRDVDTARITWIDSDMLVLREPDGFAPPAGFDFIARAGEAFDVASNGDDEKTPFWHAVCAGQGLAFDDFPTITSFPDGKPIRAYWQAGLFTFRRGGAFAPAYERAMRDLLAGSVGSRFAGVYHTDQVALALAVQASGVRAAEYAPTMNLNLNRKDPATFGRYPIGEIRIVHYHGSFWPDTVDWAREQLGGLDAEQRAVLDGAVPFTSGGRFMRVRQRLYRLRRARAIKAYERRARLI